MRKLCGLKDLEFPRNPGMRRSGTSETWTLKWIWEKYITLRRGECHSFWSKSHLILRSYAKVVRFERFGVSSESGHAPVRNVRNMNLEMNLRKIYHPLARRMPFVLVQVSPDSEVVCESYGVGKSLRFRVLRRSPGCLEWFCAGVRKTNLAMNSRKIYHPLARRMAFAWVKEWADSEVVCESYGVGKSLRFRVLRRSPKDEPCNEFQKNISPSGAENGIRVGERMSRFWGGMRKLWRREVVEFPGCAQESRIPGVWSPGRAQG